MKRFSSFLHQGKQLSDYLKESSKNLNIQIQKIQEKLKNPIKIAFQEYNTSFSKLLILVSKLKRFEKKGVKKSLLSRFSVDKAQTHELALKIGQLRDGLKETIRLQEMFHKFNNQFQSQIKVLNQEDVQTDDLQILAHWECKLVEFQTLFKVRDALCKEPRESKLKLFFRRFYRVLTRVWDYIIIIFGGGGRE